LEDAIVNAPCGCRFCITSPFSTSCNSGERYRALAKKKGCRRRIDFDDAS
jgi:hypothetical protein